MRILDVLQPNAIIRNLQAFDKLGVLQELAAPLAAHAGVATPVLLRVLLEREQLGSTGIGGGIGIPHGKLDALDRVLLGLGLSRRGIDFDSLDGRPTRIFFLIVTPAENTGLHLKLLARISRLLKNDLFQQRLLQAATNEEVLAIIDAEDEDF